MSAGDVTTYFDGSAWVYAVEGQPPLGHRFDQRDAAVAGGSYLAKENASLHTIKDEDGSVSECVSYAELPDGADRG